MVELKEMLWCFDSGKFKEYNPRTPNKPTTNTHYDVGGISVIDVIKNKLTPEQYEGFLLGNAIKYALRMNHKGSKKADAGKLKEYSEWLDSVQ
jgi:hypothetical protein